MDSVRSGPYGQIFRPDNFVFGQVRSLPLVANHAILSCVYSCAFLTCSMLGRLQSEGKLLLHTARHESVTRTFSLQH